MRQELDVQFLTQVQSSFKKKKIKDLFSVVIWVNCVKICNQNNLDNGLINGLILTDQQSLIERMERLKCKVKILQNLKEKA